MIINKSIPILSFFTGAGFLDLGFINAGFDLVWHNENDSAFIEGFEFGMNTLFEGKIEKSAIQIQNKNSIIEVPAKIIAKEAFNNLPKPETFGIIGGPPCPDFSSAGKNRGSEGKNGFLSSVYVDRIIELEPAFFLFENVPGLLRTKKHRAYLLKLINKLEGKFLIDIDVLNALEFGVPQDRKRVFIIGFSKKWLYNSDNREFQKKQSVNWQSFLISLKNKLYDNCFDLPNQIGLPLNSKFDFIWPNPEYANAKKLYDWPTISKYGLVPKKPKDIPEMLMIHSVLCKSSEVEDLPNGTEFFNAYSDKFHTIDEGDVSGKSFKRLHRWRYSPPAAYGNNEVHLHPTKPRRLSVREALRIQSAPDKFALPPDMTLSKKFKTIGNGVPVKLANVLACSIKNFLNEEFLT